MAISISEVLGRIQSYLDNGELVQANQLVSEIEEKELPSEQDKVKIRVYKAQVLIERKNIHEAKTIVSNLINQIAKWPKSTQLQILHVSSQLSAASNDLRLLEIYTRKFLEIYENISPILQGKAEAYWADILNFRGQLLVADNELSQALKQFEEVIKYQRKLNRPMQQAIALYNAGKTANALEYSSRAELFLEEAFRYFKNLKHVEGQYLVAKSLIDTYGLINDTSSVISFQKITTELHQKLQIEQVKNKQEVDRVHTQDLRNENYTLKMEYESLEEENQELKAKIDQFVLNEKHLSEGIEYLQQKVNDFRDIKDVYSSLKDQILQLEELAKGKEEVIVHQKQTIEEQEKIITRLREAQENFTDQLEDIDTDTELDDLLGTSRLIDSIFYKLQEVKSAKVRILAMQLRVSTTNCQEVIKQFEKIGVVEVDSWNFSSPKVTLKERYIDY